jgi:hypothetical protein
MAAHKGPASLRPRCTQGGSSVAAIPVYQSTDVSGQPIGYHLQEPSSPKKNARPLKMGPESFPEMLMTDYYSALHKIPEECRWNSCKYMLLLFLYCMLPANIELN